MIHTDSSIYGTAFPTGTVDFYPNGKTIRQPGCPVRTFQIMSEADICSHHRSWKLWAESLTKESSLFISYKCRSITYLGADNCDLFDIANMGINASPK